MRNLPVLLLILAPLAFLQAQGLHDARHSVILEAAIQENPPTIQLTWKADTANLGYTVYRKDKADMDWGDTLALLGPGVTTWTDTNVVVGKGYEYRVLKSMPKFDEFEGPILGHGYLYGGIRVPTEHHRGACLLVIDSTMAPELQPEIDRLRLDLEGDGWLPTAVQVGRNTPVPDVKAVIRVWAQSVPDPEKALFLLGHVPVPYSGDIAPDGHKAEEQGAWPADGYYGDLDGDWTDSLVSINAPSNRHDNYPGDGKFDNRTFPGQVILDIGRVDLWGMDKFPEPEPDLLRRYLDRNHAWRTGQMPVGERGLVDNNFPAFAEGPGQVAWKNFAPMFGIQNVRDVPYRDSLLARSYVWSYAAGGGGPESASDISSTTLFVNDSLRTIFTFLFGSYFGDWDVPNNFLRAPLASRGTLASSWGWRPHWIVHHMALGETIGYGTRLTMNNGGLYKSGPYARYIHLGLMGDPTLRLHMRPPVRDLAAIQDGRQVHLAWAAPDDAGRYYVYRQDDPSQPFILLTPQPLSVLMFTDPCVEPGLVRYMVRPAEWRTSASGSYENLGTGIITGIDVQPWDLHPAATMASPGQVDGTASIDPTDGCLPYTFLWDNGATGPALQGLPPGTYCVTVSDCLGCPGSVCLDIDGQTATSVMPGLTSLRLLPVPVSETLTVEAGFLGPNQVSIRLTDLKGHSIREQSARGPMVRLTFDVSSLPAGTYILLLETPDGRAYRTWVKG